MKLVLIVLNKVEELDNLLEKFLENGITGATIINSNGMLHELYNHDEENYFSLFKYLINPDRKENKTIFLIASDDEIETIVNITDKVVGGLDNPDTGVLSVLPLDFVKGVYKK